MVFIQVKVTGLNECKIAIDKARTGLPDTMKLMLQDVSNMFVTEAQKNAHVITGNMKQNIIIDSINQQTGQAVVKAAADYSLYENARGPPHNFMDQAYQTTKQNSMKQVVARLNTLFRSSQLPLK